MLLFFCFVLSFGQEKANSKTVYVCFTKDFQSEKNTLKKNSDFENFVKTHGISFVNDFGFSNERLDEMAAESRRIGNSDESIQKLKRIFKVKISSHDENDVLKITSTLKRFPEIEYVSVVDNTPIKPPFVNIYAVTPNLEVEQNYLVDKPGINAKYAWTRGITGQNIRIRDVEYGFYKEHEMLANMNTIQLESGYSLPAEMNNPNSQYYRWPDHGTGVVSIMGSKKDNVGISGAAYGAAEIKGYMEWTSSAGYSRANAVSRSINASHSGDIILYEMQTGGKGGEFCPAEYDEVIWDLTKAATDSGIIIIAAAGNGNQNLNDPFYSSYNARGNSGAIMVGAGSSNSTHSRLYFSTYGNRVDVQGWGENVLAGGYGDYAKYDNDLNRTYTRFSGTSSATPVVASAATLIQSYYYQRTGQYLTPIAMKNLLVSTGIPQGGSNTNEKIGPFPNVKAAILSLESQLDTFKTSSDEKAVNSVSEPLEVKIYPNPATQYISLKCNTDKVIDIEIVNMNGQSLIKKSTASNKQIDISQLPAGNYIINIYEGQRRVVEKFTKR